MGGLRVVRSVLVVFLESNRVKDLLRLGVYLHVDT